MKILMVCLGNICRSPMAEGILKHKLSESGISHITVQSCGTAGYHIGEKADSRAIRTLAQHGIDISSHRARQLRRSDFFDYDRIYAMDDSNLHNILSVAPDAESKKKVSLILNELHPNADQSVGDPYYGGEQGFEDVFSLLLESSQKIVDKLV